MYGSGVMEWFDQGVVFTPERAARRKADLTTKEEESPLKVVVHQMKPKAGVCSSIQPMRAWSGHPRCCEPLRMVSFRAKRRVVKASQPTFIDLLL